MAGNMKRTLNLRKIEIYNCMLLCAGIICSSENSNFLSYKKQILLAIQTKYKKVQENDKDVDPYSLSSPKMAQSSRISLACRSIDAVHINVSSFQISNVENFRALIGGVYERLDVTCTVQLHVGLIRNHSN